MADDELHNALVGRPQNALALGQNFAGANEAAQALMPRGVFHGAPGVALFRMLFGLGQIPREVVQSTGRAAFGLGPTDYGPTSGGLRGLDFSRNRLDEEPY